MTKLIETKVLLDKADDKILAKLAKADGGRSKTKFCTNAIKELIENFKKK